MFANKRLGPFMDFTLQQHQEGSTNTCTSPTGQNNGSGDNDNFDKTKLIVNYIPQYTTEEDLAIIFSQIGPIENIRIMKNLRTGYSYGYGFVKYLKPEDAAKAIEALSGLNYRNKRLKVSYSRPPGQTMKESNLYISNLPKDITEKDLDRIFGEYGEIIQRNVLKDKITGLPRGVAFVRFSKREEAQAAIANLDGKQLEKSTFPLSVRVADDHSKQKAQFLEHQSYFLSRDSYQPVDNANPIAYPASNSQY
ncbi:RNA binding protein [Oryctes borbonicus]|uniref:RNA binding protein n=1 Tax=Oryctes borbonicus TaxID=1629725 RepID=A0A0T6BBU3_9SCAR|nr:RNA binding protein [Oryctes borbonicus]